MTFQKKMKDFKNKNFRKKGGEEIIKICSFVIRILKLRVPMKALRKKLLPDIQMIQPVNFRELAISPLWAELILKYLKG